MQEDNEVQRQLIAGCIRAGYTALVVAVVAQAPEVVLVLLAVPLPMLTWELRTLTLRS
jgi:hypothetical protein